MLDIPGFKSLRKVLWKDLDPGMIVVGGVKVNNGLHWLRFPHLQSASFTS
jgi:hypothetical protein